MVIRWRDLPAPVQDLLGALAFACLWFGAYLYWRDGGWLPRNPETYELAGAWSAGALALRRVVPVPSLIVTVALYPFFYSPDLQTEFHLLPIMIAGYGATVVGRAASTLVGLACLGAGLAVSVGPYESLTTLDWSSVLFNEFAIAGVVLLGTVVNGHQQIAATLSARNTELERLRQVDARAAIAFERTRIARELHDVVAHHLTAMIVRAQAADRVSAVRPEVAVESLGWMAQTSREALTAMRETVRVLREDGVATALAPGPTLSDLPGMAERIRVAGLDVDVDVPSRLPVLSPQAELAAVRITQEALTNSLRHAQATRVSVAIRAAPDVVVLDIDDDGSGRPVPDLSLPGTAARSTVDGHGLLGMQERAASCGGHLMIGRSTLGGWQVRAVLPLRTPDTPA